MDVELEADEQYILLLLSDSNLPTGSFVASAGLESYGKHGFLSLSNSAADGTTTFVRESLATYARSALPFVSDAHSIVQSSPLAEPIDLTAATQKLSALDELYETTTLNHVAKRASAAQGVALLTLYSKGFSKTSPSRTFTRADKLKSLIDKFKMMVRREETRGHLPVCWGVLTGALGLSLERAQYLHLFLHARGLLSSAVRLNTMGPYSAQQHILHTVKPWIEEEIINCRDLRTGLSNTEEADSVQEGPNIGPATTWPLGEILAARHDLQHSRIFNS
ncbi:urease accessory protein UreF [Coniophora puteana RWD-64-598 SS2]|uniref:Urease accessory protein UreF n=1 Tax=Coniophora puteana (strain RWD-64-598) TaxID=741705 RepID=A0A5M3MSX9_CONPW|nr:urease accessory protein UreF [Coniophora puteana RWD-64-598 SS2]EIW82272.1 urease accessory protein UreF [Coniophora puteana RWD-64-598 SS2]